MKSPSSTTSPFSSTCAPSSSHSARSAARRERPYAFEPVAPIGADGLASRSDHGRDDGIGVGAVDVGLTLFREMRQQPRVGMDDAGHPSRRPASPGERGNDVDVVAHARGRGRRCASPASTLREPLRLNASMFSTGRRRSLAACSARARSSGTISSVLSSTDVVRVEVVVMSVPSIPELMSRLRPPPESQPDLAATSRASGRICGADVEGACHSTAKPCCAVEGDAGDLQAPPPSWPRSRRGPAARGTLGGTAGPHAYSDLSGSQLRATQASSSTI